MRINFIANIIFLGVKAPLGRYPKEASSVLIRINTGSSVMIKAIRNCDKKFVDIQFADGFCGYGIDRHSFTIANA